MRRSMPRPTSRKGTPRPMEYIKSRKITRGVDPWLKANVETAPSTGPMHGVQPTANAIPRGSAPTEPGRTRARSGRPSQESQGIRARTSYRTRKIPNARTNAPATRRPAGDRNHARAALAVKPNTRVNTSENPRMNRRMGTTGRRARSAVERSPVTNDRYPGTRGSTQGEAKETTPAAKARAGPHHSVTLAPTLAIIGPILAAARGKRGSPRPGNRDQPGLQTGSLCGHSVSDACEELHKPSAPASRPLGPSRRPMFEGLRGPPI